MASGHVYRANQAEHMAAPTNAASEDSSCQPGAVHTWPHGCRVAALHQVGSYLGYTGHQISAYAVHSKQTGPTELRH